MIWNGARTEQLLLVRSNNIGCVIGQGCCCVWVRSIGKDLNLRFPKLEGKKARPDVLSGSNQLFVACQTDDDLPYVLKYAGENCLMIGSDYGHADNASELLALAKLKDNGEIAPHVIDKILCHNPAKFYGLDVD